jgi:hypothetical protein
MSDEVEKKENVIMQKCTNCKVSRSQDNFIGKSGQPVNRCLKCREKDAKQKQRPDVIAKRNIRQNEKQYYKAYREKKRLENETEYLQHNADVAKNWRNENKEHLAKWKTKNFVSRFYGIKQQAHEKNIRWADDMTDEIAYNMMNSPCYYCGILSKDTLNGIDRMDSKGSYELNNCVPSCKYCNFIKRCLDPRTFTERCIHIVNIIEENPDLYYYQWEDCISMKYNEYKYRAKDKNLEFTLTQELFDKITQSNCSFCNRETTNTHRNGIDRNDNSIGYIESNCIPCCNECNYMKGSLTYIQFIECCKNVRDYYYKNKDKFVSVFETIPPCKYSIIRDNVKHVIEKSPIYITKQQPNQPKREPIEIPEYIPKERDYKANVRLPEGCGVNSTDIPKFCSYLSASETRGDGFSVDKRHPQMNGKTWTTTRSKVVSTKEKFQLLMDYLSKLE